MTAFACIFVPDFPVQALLRVNRICDRKPWPCSKAKRLSKKFLP